MSSTLVASNDSTINTSAITGSKAGGASVYSSKEGYERQNSFSKDSGSGWGSISPRKGEGFQWSQKQPEQGLIGKLLDSNTSQIERSRYSGLVQLSPSNASRAQTFSSQSAAQQSSQTARAQGQQQSAVFNQQQQFAQPQQTQQQQFVQQSAPLLQKQQSVTQTSSFVGQQSLPLTQSSQFQQQQWVQPSQTTQLQQQWSQPTKTLWASETGPVTIQQPGVCLPLEALVIKPEPIMVPQPPVVFQPEAIQVAQPPIVFRPEPITIPMPPLTIQPEPVVVQRPPVMVQPPPIVLRRPDVQMNSVFNVALKYGCSTNNEAVCSSDQCVPISSLSPAQRASFNQLNASGTNQFTNSGSSSLSQVPRANRAQTYSTSM